MAAYLAAAVQFEPEFGAPAANRRRLAGLVAEAAAAGALLVVLPEMATTGYAFRSRDEIGPYVEPIPGPTTRWAGELARRYGMHLVIGLPEVDEDSGIYYNSAALIDVGGEVLGKYRKLHSFVDETRWARDGDLGVPVFDTPLGPMAMIICMDADYFETARLAALSGADVIAFPTNWLGPAPSKSWRARALENGVYVLAADRWGEERGTRFAGGTAVIGPGGEVLACRERGDGVVLAAIDPDVARERRRDLLARRLPREYHGVVINSYLFAPAAVQGLPPERESGIGVLQLRARPGDAGAMLAAALEGIEALYQRCRAQGRSLDLVVLPEALVAGGAGQPELAEEIPGPVTGRMLELATRLDLHLAFGVPERTPRGIYSSVVLVGPGEVQGLYRKLHLTAADREWGCLPGDLGFPTFDLPLGRVALLCADDLLYPEAPRSVAKKGADLICAPGAWTDPSTTWLWADRWSGNDTFLAVANLAGGGFAGGSAVYGDLERGDRARVSEPEGSAYVRVNTAWGRRVRQKETLRRLQPHWYAPLVGGQVGRAHRC